MALASSSNAPVSVIGSEFTVPYAFDIIVDKSPGGEMIITDVNHKILLKVKSCDTSFHSERVLLTADDKVIVKLREKIMSEHNRWNVYRGDSKADENLIFSTKEKNWIQFKTSLQVFLANKTSGKDVCDFMIKGSWSKKNCQVYVGDNDSITIAQMHKKDESKKLKSEKNKFMVSINPNVDYAFVVALIAIIGAINTVNENTSAGILGEVIGAVVGS
ncbi:hypothetical protein QVD17_06294 [Tagetes erecta]|uniref:Uncharacterized protein n=1 Tax=Tagetes erecta TaxID=13708 RepID=A0AAD8LFD1_TARER|nr:hypothetical protein QVD17_06294 [Tagetes erecta]